MKADQTTLANLQIACATFAALASQQEADQRQLKSMDLDWLACRSKKWYHGTKRFLRKFVDRLLAFGQDPQYSAGSVTPTSTVTSLLERESQMVSAAHDQIVAFRKQAWDSNPDYTTDIYEHAIRELEKQLVKIERELVLLKELGEETYISSRLSND